MPFFEHGDVRIHYEDTGSGFPLLIIPGGGLNSTITFPGPGGPFDPRRELGGEFRCIVADLRNAAGGESSGPLEVDRPWDAYSDDQLGLMDHLGVDNFMVLGFCIGGPMIWNLLRRASERIVTAVLAQPSGFRPELPNLFYENNTKNWVPSLLERHPEVSEDSARAFLTNMYGRSDFVFTVSRDFVRACRTPILVLPDDVPAHPYAVAMEAARLAPNAQVSLYPWKEPPELLPLALRHIRMFLQANLHAFSGSTTGAAR
jgi:pimeloyl-ACP methyl ester carboxylesterase